MLDEIASTPTHLEVEVDEHPHTPPPVSVARAGTRKRRHTFGNRLVSQGVVNMTLLRSSNSEQVEASAGSSHVGGEGAGGVGDYLEERGGQENKAPAPIGLIGHFEAQVLMDHKGRNGLFVASLDMSMTQQDLVSTEEGVGKLCGDTGDDSCTFADRKSLPCTVVS